MNITRLVSALAVFAFASTSAFAAGYADVSIDQLEEAIDTGSVVVIDVNGSNRYAKGHIPGAIDFSSAEDLATLLPEDKSTMIVAYCGGPRCSAYMKAAKAAEKLGYTNVKHLSAGISGWKDAGKPLEKAASKG